MKSLPYQTIRDMANDLQSERIKYLKRAAECYKHGNMTGMGSASYYSTQGRNLTSKVEKIHRIAAQITLETVNQNLKISKTLDLHHLYVNEALQVAREFIKHFESTGERGVITIVTGRGNHSTAGKSRLTPAIWNMLKSDKKSFTFDGNASFSIFFS